MKKLMILVFICFISGCCTYPKYKSTPISAGYFSSEMMSIAEYYYRVLMLYRENGYEKLLLKKYNAEDFEEIFRKQRSGL